MINSYPITETTKPGTTSGNNLFPIFLKLENFRLLIIGGGNVALEKLNAVLQNSPATKITMVAITFNYEIRETARNQHNVHLIEKKYDASDLVEADIIIAAVNDLILSKQISDDANIAGKLVNVADKPELCDFYLSSVVKKGNLKVAISTNGKSPTIAKRLKEVLNDTLPAELDDVLDNMVQIRKSLKGDFTSKVIKLNEITKSLAANSSTKTGNSEKIVRVILYIFLIITCIIACYILLSLF